MAFKTTRNTGLFQDHSRLSNVLQPLDVGENLEPANATATVNSDDWIKVIYTPPAGAAIVGWVLAAHCELADSVRPGLKVGGFVRSCFMIEQLFNVLPTATPWFADAQYVIARAIIETGLTNAGAKLPGSDAVGPLQVSSQEWLRFVNEGNDFAKDFRAADEPNDRNDPQLPVYAAIFRMHTDAEAIAKLRPPSAAEPGKQFIPTFLDLFHAYILNNADAANALIDAQQDDTAKNAKIDVLLNRFMSKAEVGALFDARSKYLGTAGNAKTVAEVVAATQSELAAALEKAFDLAKINAPEELPPEPSQPTVIQVQDIPTDVVAVPKADPAPFATIKGQVEKMFWPVITRDPQAMVVSYLNADGKVVGSPGRKFFADRNGGARHHVGMDVFCWERDIVVACAPGKIVAFYSFYKRPTSGEDTYALFIAHDGVVINYGEVKPDARNEFGWRIGDTVDAGQKIARVSGTNMIHFETYVPGTTQNSRWLAGGARPASLLNPTMLLLTLASGARRIKPDGSITLAQGSAKTQTATGGALDDGDILTLARTIYGEARSSKEPTTGREAVGHVVMTRVQRRFMGDDTISKVCLRASQFSCWNKKDPNRPVILAANRGSNPVFDQCLDLAEQVTQGVLPDNTGGATHYYSETIAPPKWAAAPAQQTTQIGSHRFFKNVK